MIRESKFEDTHADRREPAEKSGQEKSNTDSSELMGAGNQLHKSRDLAPDLDRVRRATGGSPNGSELLSSRRTVNSSSFEALRGKTNISPTDDQLWDEFLSGPNVLLPFGSGKTGIITTIRIAKWWSDSSPIQAVDDLLEFTAGAINGAATFLSEFRNLKAQQSKGTLLDGDDKWFHAKANYLSTSYGVGGEYASRYISNTVEVADLVKNTVFRGKTFSKSKAMTVGDLRANRVGRSTFGSGLRSKKGPGQYWREGIE